MISRVLSVVLLLLPMAQVVAQSNGQTQEQRIGVLERRLKAMSTSLLRLDSLQREVQQLRGEVEILNHSLDAMRSRQRDLYLDLDQRLGQGGVPADTAPPPAEPVTDLPPVQQPAAPPESPAPPPTDAPLAEQEQAYQAAYKLLRERRYEEAKQALEAFLTRYPGGGFADNAQYWLAEASYVTRDYEVALVDFDKVLKHYPLSPKVPGAMLKVGYILYDKNQLSEARETLQTLLKRYPDSAAARLAQEFMRSKGI